MAPKISVIVHSYTHAVFVQDAIESVLDQSYRDFEIIVVDHGLGDAFPVGLRNHPQVRYIRQQSEGTSAARNTGIRLAKGEIICLLGPDELYEPSFLKVMVGVLEKNPGVEAGYCRHQLVDDQKIPVPYSSSRTVPAHLLFNNLICGNFIVPASVAAYKCCYRQAGPFDTALTAGENWDMWLRFAKRFNFVGIEQTLVRCRTLSDRKPRNSRTALKNREAVLAKHLPVGTSPELRNRAYAETYLRASIEYLQSQDEENGRRYFELMSRTWPALLENDRVFYELACATRPRESSGYPESLKLLRSEAALFGLLDGVFFKPDPVLLPVRRLAYANAYFAFAKLSYLTHDFRKSREYLLKAARFHFRITFRKEFVSTLVKCQFLLRAPFRSARPLLKRRSWRPVSSLSRRI